MASSWPAGVILKSDAGQSLKLRPKVDDGGPRLLEDFTPGGIGRDYSQALTVSGFGVVEVDAISTGNGFIPGLDSNGTPTMGARFLVAAMSVDAATSPGPNVFNSGTSATLPGAAIGSYYFHESKYIPWDLVGENRLEFNGDDVRLQQSQNPAQNPDLVGLDFGMGIHDLGVDTSGSQFFRQGEWLYFSVTPEWADDNQQPFAALGLGQPATENPLPGDIYVRRWNNSGPQIGWDGPYLFASAQELGFDPVPSGTLIVDYPDVDALDFDSHHNIVVYSMTEGTRSMLHSNFVSSQLMVVDFQEGTNPGYNLGAREANPTSLKSRHAGQSQKVTTRIRITDLTGTGSEEEEEEIDAICTWDPEGGAVTPNAMTPVREGAAPSVTNPSLAHQMSISMVRVPNTSSSLLDRGVLQVSGWGWIQPQPAIIEILKKDGPVQGGSPSDWQTIAYVQRHANRHDTVFEYDTLSAYSSTSSAEFTSFRAKLWIRDRTGHWIVVGTSWAGEIASM